MTEIVNLPGAKNAFAVGLAWRHEDTVPKAKQLRALSLSNGRWGIVRTTSTGAIQAGFCKPVDGIKSPTKLRSLAAVIADHRPQPWMGLYELSKDRYWYIAVRDGQAVIPGGDQIGTFDEMMRVRDTHLSYGEWTEVEGTIDDLAEMARLTPRALTLKDYQDSPWRAAAIGGSALVAVGAVTLGGWMWHEHQADVARKAINDRLNKIVAAQKALKNAESKVLPWTHQPMPSKSFDACHSVWTAQKLAPSGWTLATWDCRVDDARVSIDTSWDRDGGIADQAPGLLSSDGEHSTLSVQYPARIGTSTAYAAPDVTALRAIWSLAQTHGLDLTLTKQPIASINALPGAPQPTQQDNPWTPTPATFKHDAPPWAGLGHPFDSVPGLRVLDVSWSAATGGWTTTATLYTLRGVPATTAAPSPAKAHTRSTGANS